MAQRSLRADALEKAGRASEAVITLRKLYYDAPQSAEAEKAGARLATLGASTAPADAAQLKRRADKLYQSGLYAIAAQAYDQIPRLFPNAVTDDVRLRAESATTNRIRSGRLRRRFRRFARARRS